MPKSVNAAKIINIVKELQKIRQMVKCSICLDIVKDPLQIGCPHIFCSECFNKYETDTMKGKDCFCPVCRAPLNRRQKRQHNTAIKVAEYVNKVGGILSNLTNCNIFEVPEEQIQQNLKSSTTLNARKRKNSVATPKRTAALSIQTPKKSKFTTINDLNTSSVKKVTKTGQEQTKNPVRKSLRKSSKNNLEVSHSHSSNFSEKENIFPKKDPFDLLLESSNVPPNSTLKSKIIRTYPAKSKTNNKYLYVDKVVDFQDNTNKTRTLQWLNDTRNKFDGIVLTQTQNDDRDSDTSSVISLSMPSISQVNKKKNRASKTTSKHAATQKISAKDNQKNLKKRRAASLDRCFISMMRPKQRLKRHSIACESQDYDNMIIEIVDSDNECCDSKKQWNLLEEQSLKDIENCTPKRGRKMTDKSKKDPNNSVSQKSQWDRLKSISKQKRKMKKLDVSQCNSSVTPESNKSGKGKVLKSITNNDIITIDFKQPQKTDTNSKKQAVNVGEKNTKNKAETKNTYDLEIIESYFSKNLMKYINNKQLNENIKNNNINTPERESSKPAENTNCVLKAVENIKTNETKKSNSIKRKLNYTSNSVFIEKVTIQDKKDINITPNTSIDEQEQFKGFSKPKTECDAYDEDVLKPTQVFLLNFQNLNEFELIENLNGLVKKLFNEIDFQKQSQSNVNIDIFEPILTAMKFLIGRMEQKNEEQSKTDLKDACTQTDILLLRDSSVQTAVDLNNAFTQTDPMQGFYISSNESFKTPAKTHTETQTENSPQHTGGNKDDLNLLPPPNGFKRTLTNENNSNSYQFTQSLDNINFETQDILNKKLLSQPLNKFVPKPESQLKRKELTPQISASNRNNNKVNDDSTDSQKNSSSSRRALNQVFNKIEVDEKTKFKRVRKPESDSDSDSEIRIQPKKLCNKFINNDLIVKFESQCDDLPNTERKTLGNEILSCDSEKIDYEEFLEKVLKKYEDPPRNVKPVPKTQDIIEKCEKIIREATLLRPQEIMQNLSTPNTQQKTNKLSFDTMQEFNQEFNYVKSNQTNSQDVHAKELNNNNNVNPFSLSLFGNSEEEARNANGKSSINSNKKFSRRELDDYVKEISNEFEKSFDDVDAELARVHESQKKQQKIVILQDIKLNNVVTDKVINKDVIIENFDDSFDNIDAASHKSDDMFDDVDVVENTPQKKKKTSTDRENPLDDPETKQTLTIDEDVINCLNMTFTPPPGFQDSEDPNDATLKNNDELKTNTNEPEIKKFTYGISSLTPDLLLEPNPSLKRHQKLPETSTPNMLEPDLTLVPLSLSPINPSQNQFTGPLNPIDIAKSSKFSPLMIVKSKLPPQRILTSQTSTPKQKSILNYVKQDNMDASPKPGCSRYPTPVEEVITITKPCVSCTRLTLEQVMAINSLASKKLVSYSGSFSKSVTHMIVATNAKGCVKDHTMKYVFAVAAGIWVLSFNWIEESLRKKCLVPEEPFEVKDVSGLSGPRQSRLIAKRDLLKGFKIHVAKPFVSTTAEEVENVVRMLAGKVVPRPDDLLSRNGYTPLIITEARASQDFELYETWLESLRTVTVDLEWLSRSVGQYQLQNLRPFTLCSEDSICELGYPSAITADVTITSQSVSTIS